MAAMDELNENRTFLELLKMMRNHALYGKTTRWVLAIVMEDEGLISYRESVKLKAYFQYNNGEFADIDKLIIDLEKNYD